MEGLQKIADTCDVSAVGVLGAKKFFEAKAEDVCVNSIILFILPTMEQSCSQ